MVRALTLVALVATPAFADRDLCAPGTKHHGAPIDLDVNHADVRDVLRLLADTANVNLVIADDVAGKVTLKLKRVAWDAATCAIAGVQHLRVTVEDNNILLVRRDK
jgi:type II secretory pathway component HofQ